MTEDEQMALEHLRQEKRREAFQRHLQSLLLPKDQGPAQQVRKNFAPLTILGRIKGQAR